MEMQELKERIPNCPNCGRHCPIDAVSCPRGEDFVRRALSGELDAEALSGEARQDGGFAHEHGESHHEHGDWEHHSHGAHGHHGHGGWHGHHSHGEHGEHSIHEEQE